ncbi:MAG TPA: sodium:solute symporter family protein [Acidobacteriaceae bacterium]|nr:sodium:solute symporter family protein [Acidobacteriaceae bacterium]
MSLYVIVLVGIVLSLLAVSLTRLGRVKTKADYLVAGRTLPAFVLIFTLLSSWIGSGSLLAGAENAYRHGFAALWQAAGGWFGLLLIYFIAPRARKFAQFTIPDLLEARYSQTARVLGVIAILFAYTGITSYQLIGGGDILHLVFPAAISPLVGKYIMAAFVIVFTAIAGMSSVAYMDVFIGLLATVTMLVALPFLAHSAGGWRAIHHALPATHFEVLGDFTFVGAMELMIPTLLLMLGNQAMYQKFFSAKSEHDARVAVVGWIIGTIILETVIVAIAVVGSVLFPHGPVSHYPREIIAYTALHGLPALLGALLMGAVFAKIMSTANNFLFSPATNLINDVYVRYLSPNASDRRILLVSRLTVVLLGVWSLYQTMNVTNVLQETLYAYTVYSAALTPVILAAFYSKRANAAGAVTAIGLGTFVTVLWNIAFPDGRVSHWIVRAGVAPHLAAQLALHDAIFPALVAAVLGLVAVSVLTRPPSAEQVALFHSGAGEPARAEAD